MTFQQHILILAERMLATVLPGAWQPAVSATPVMLRSNTYPPRCRGAYGEPANGSFGYETRDICGFEAESSHSA